jgi:predicted GIY-YIG superfamily endonuclease
LWELRAGTCWKFNRKKNPLHQRKNPPRNFNLPEFEKEVFMFTVYGLVDPRDSLIRYVGITDDIYRRFKEHMRANGKNPGMNAWMKTLQAEQEMLVMVVLERAESYHEALRLEAEWIQQLLLEGCLLFNVSGVEPPAPKEPVVSSTGKRRVYNGHSHGRRYTGSQIDEILDWYLTTGELPNVSQKQRWLYKHHPRLEDRRRLLQPAGAKGE